MHGLLLIQIYACTPSVVTGSSSLEERNRSSKFKQKLRYPFYTAGIAREANVKSRRQGFLSPSGLELFALNF